ncbi:MAG TPA: multicopper oxidase family protein [Microbacterium sp.]|nr:multicopper oxidase family protein [Microbacterium sp.]
MPAVLLGLGYLLLAAAGAAAWGLALARSVRSSRAAPSPARVTGLLVAGALVLLAGRWVIVGLLAELDTGFIQEKAFVGLPISTAASLLAALSWWLPRRGRAATGWRDAVTTGTFAAAAAAAGAEIVLTVIVGAPAGPVAAVAVVAAVLGAGVVAGLVFARPPGASSAGRGSGLRRPAIAAGVAAVSLIAGAVVVGLLAMTGAGALNAAGFGPVDVHAHGPDAAVADAGTPVTDLVEAPTEMSGRSESIDVSLRAQQQTIALPSGRTVEAWTFGELAGPAIVARVGDTLDVHLTNDDVERGATVHWHGYPVANAYDGVAGVTQDVVRPGEEFDADIALTQPGTYWYHTHQRGSEGVVRGLYGTLVVEPESGPTEDVDITLPVHTLSGQIVLATSDVLEERAVAPGDSVRLRLINTDQTPHTFAVQGAPFRVVAIDGTDVASALLEERSLVIPAGGRIDVVLEMPDTPVRVGVAVAREAGMALLPRVGDDIPALTVPPTAFDPLADLVDRDSVAAAPPSDAAIAVSRARDSEEFDVERTVVLDRLPRFVQGVPNYGYTVDGRVYPYIEPTIVDLGDTVRMRVVNRSFETHPMHPHGHSVRVLSVDGVEPAQPLWLDTFDVGPGEVWEVALYADNPGIWMDHCHNLEHAARGMVTHLAYRGITTPFDHGGPADNAPE